MTDVVIAAPHMKVLCIMLSCRNCKIEIADDILSGSVMMRTSVANVTNVISGKSAEKYSIWNNTIMLKIHTLFL